MQEVLLSLCMWFITNKNDKRRRCVCKWHPEYILQLNTTKFKAKQRKQNGHLPFLRRGFACFRRVHRNGPALGATVLLFVETWAIFMTCPERWCLGCWSCLVVLEMMSSLLMIPLMVAVLWLLRMRQPGGKQRMVVDDCCRGMCTVMCPLQKVVEDVIKCDEKERIKQKISQQVIKSSKRGGNGGWIVSTGVREHKLAFLQLKELRSISCLQHYEWTELVAQIYSTSWVQTVSSLKFKECATNWVKKFTAQQLDATQMKHKHLCTNERIVGASCNYNSTTKNR